MGLIRPQDRRHVRRFFLLCLVLVCTGGGNALFSQNTGTPLSLEIKGAEETLAGGDPAATPAAKEAALIRLARLSQLAGDLEAASENWFAAAAAGQGVHNDYSLVSGAFCLAAMGEWEKAEAAMVPLLRGGQGPVYSRARYLEACAEAWLRSDASLLRAMADNAAHGGLRSAVYYTLWKLAHVQPEIKESGTAAQWKARLSTEFPRSPEDRITDTAPAAPVMARPSPLWLLMPEPAGPREETVTPPDIPAARTVSAPAVRYVQTGLFGKESNAQNQAQKLTAAGFAPVINRRTVNGGDFWAVTVPAGADINRTIRELKNSGFDSFPL